MKKTLFFAAAALALASCSQDEVLEVNRGEAISFRTVVNGNTRAADITTSNIAEFSVSAINESDVAYMDDITVTKTSSAWEYSPAYYWPASGSLDFYAYAPLSGVTRDAYNKFSLTTAAAAADQIDLVYAVTEDQTKADNSATGVALNFRHAMSKISLKVLNSNASMTFDITGWKLVKIDNEATYTWSGEESSLLKYADWSDNAGADQATESTDAFTKTSTVGTTAAAIDGATDMILIPQQVAKAAKYAGSANTDKISGAYIAIEMVIKNAATDDVIAAKQWCCWPVAFNWVPGKNYTYVVDLADGGYKETNDGAAAVSGHAADDLDPVLDGAVIKFVTITVDDWTTVADQTIPYAQS